MVTGERTEVRTEERRAAARAALRAGRWAEARAALEAELEEGEAGEAGKALREPAETAEVLYGMGEALWWLGEPRQSVAYHERAYAAFRRAGDTSRAAWTAMWLGLTYEADFGNHAAAGGWIARAERVLRGAGAGPSGPPGPPGPSGPPGSMQGWLWLTRAYHTADLARSRRLGERALDLARDLGDADLELCALGHLGAALVALGEVEAGLSLIDESMAGTFGGERSRLDTVVFTCCSMLTACELAADVERATQWCRVADDFIRTYGCPFLRAYCRASFGSVLVASGSWTDAERELGAAIRITAGTYPAMHALAVARLADLRLHQGRLEEAEGLLAGVDAGAVGGASTLPAAGLRLARGEPAVAVALLERWLNLNGGGDPEAAPILELLVEAHLTRGDPAAAAAAAARLNRLSSRRDLDHVAARAAGAAARVLEAKGERGAAVRQLEVALARFSRLGLPLETARARLRLARALAPDEPAIAVAEARDALVAFERLGARGDADATAALLRALGARGRTGPREAGVLTQREREVLGLLGAGLSNPEIGRRLVISRKTAAHHVSSILGKLGLRNRAEAVAYTTRAAVLSPPEPP
jgi:ATP/maltotriose-dependent transcriptional regulator MalT